jgi:hypothetical protein
MNRYQQKAEKRIRKLIISTAKSCRIQNLMFLLPQFKSWLERLYDFPSHSDAWVEKLLNEIELEVKKHQ